MIAFACATTDERQFRASAARAIEAVSEEDSLLMRRHVNRTVAEAWNEMLVDAGKEDDLEAVVLLDQSVFVDGDDFLPKARELLAAHEDVAIVGAVGARGVTGPAWWEGECHGALALPTAVPGGKRLRYSRGAWEVETVSGTLLILSEWATRKLRFDPGLSGSLAACAADVCLQARSSGRRVIAADLGASFYGVSRNLIDRRPWVQAAVALNRKWAEDLVPRDL